jgi:glycosyltransferase involved in cell wall biosynthesis
MNEKNISCVVATHNRDEYLKEAIYSIIKQTRAPLEIIVSDNVPSKKTELVVKEIASKNSIPLNYIGHKLGGRGCISRNLAVSESKGEYIAFLDDDDLWDPDYLEKISSLISKKKSKIIYAWLIDWHNNINKPGKKLQPDLPIETFLYKNPGSVISNLVVDRKTFVSLGGFDEYIHPSYDKDFLIRALHFGYKYDVLKDSLVYMRRDNHKRESKIDKDFLIGMKKFYKKHEFNATFITKIKFWTKYYWYYIHTIINESR